MNTSNFTWRSKRTAQNKNGTIVFGAGPTVYRCLVVDTSLSGARLRVEHRNPIPNNFALVIEDGGIQAECEIVWRKGMELGVRILSSRPRAQRY